jgi:hypothetical protein
VEFQRYQIHSLLKVTVCASAHLGYHMSSSRLVMKHCIARTCASSCGRVLIQPLCHAAIVNMTGLSRRTGDVARAICQGGRLRWTHGSEGMTDSVLEHQTSTSTHWKLLDCLPH